MDIKGLDVELERLAREANYLEDLRQQIYALASRLREQSSAPRPKGPCAQCRYASRCGTRRLEGVTGGVCFVAE